MRREYIDERIEFKDEVKEKIYMKARGLCACCGVKLNKNNRSIDHAVPLALGGTNDLRNMIPLCKVCNNLKDSDFYWPGSFYVTLNRLGATSVVAEVTEYTLEWVERWCTKEDIISNPLIAEKITTFIVPLEQNKLDKMRKDKLLIKPFMWDLTELKRNEDKTEIWQRTNVTGKMIRDSVINYKEDYCVFALKKRSSNAWGLLCSVQIQGSNVYISELWRGLGYKMTGMLINFMVRVFYRIWLSDKVGCDKVIATLLDKNSYSELVNCYLYTEFNYPSGYLPGTQYVCEDDETALQKKWDSIKDRSLVIKFVTDNSCASNKVQAVIDGAKNGLRSGGK